jgi:hypothetical protein
MNNVLRITISCVFAIVVLVLCSFIIVSIGIEGGTLFHIISAFIAVTAGRLLNSFLKKKYSRNGKDSKGE